MECGCSDIQSTDIHQWEEMYKERYGHKFVERHSDPRRRAMYRMTTEELKGKLCDDPCWKSIIKEMYPRFPEYLGRADSILLFFDLLSKERRTDELREIIISRNNLM